jgi:glycine betaine catabolism A
VSRQHRRPSNPPGYEQDFAAAERCQLAANSRAYATGGVLVPSEHQIGLFHEWVIRQLDTYVGHV